MGEVSYLKLTAASS